MPKTILILIGVFLAGALFLGGYLLFPVQEYEPRTQVQTQPTISDTSKVTPVGPRSTQKLPNVSDAYSVLFARVDATSLTFSNVSSNSGEMGSVYALYAEEAKEYSALFPGNTFSVSLSQVDLNADQTAEMVVYVDAPGWCGATGACPLDVYQKDGSGWKLILRTLALGEVGLSTARTGEYADLIMSALGDISSETVIVRYVWDGKTYNPVELLARWDGEKFILMEE